MVLRFRIKDGSRAGQVTRLFGGVWDKRAHRGAGEWVGWYDPIRGWQGKQPSDIRTVEISAQQAPYVLDFIRRMILAIGGRRSGKTGGLAPKAAVCGVIFSRRKGGILAPTYRQARNVWRYLLRILPRNWLKPGHKGISKQEHTLRFIHGGSLVLVSADRSEGSRSEGVAYWGVEERQDIDDEAFQNAVLSTSEGGANYILFETGTIPRLDHKNYEDFKDHHDKLVKSAKGAVYRMVSKGNPFIDHSFLDDAAEFLDQRAIERELEAEWPEREGLVYYPFHDGLVKTWPIPGWKDVTAARLREKFDAHGAQFFVSVDPPKHAVIYKIFEDPMGNDVLHAVSEVVIGGSGDVRDLATSCAKRCGIDGDKGSAVAIRDPHDTHHAGGKKAWDVDKYFRNAGFRMAFMRRVGIEYRITCLRALQEKRRWLVDPSCKHLKRAMREQVYDKNCKPDKSKGLDHIADAAGYGPYKLYPAKIDYEKREKRAA